MINKVSQWGGAAFMLGSLLFLVNKLNEMSWLFLSRWMPDVISGQDTLLILIGQAALLLAMWGFGGCMGNEWGAEAKMHCA